MRHPILRDAKCGRFEGNPGEKFRPNHLLHGMAGVFRAVPAGNGALVWKMCCFKTELGKMAHAKEPPPS